MHVEINGKVEFKQFSVYRHNVVTGEVVFIQDFDDVKEAELRAEKVSHGLVLGVVFKFIALGVNELGETMDSQAEEAMWRQKQQGGGLVVPGGGLKV